ncbi:MAG: hypothetical protein IJJ26_07925 [Victivallales bacterium]|nr:hypothetical protein [Victivallales bacterium]
MPKILIVCKTNRSASPMAAAYLQAKTREAGLNEYEFCSAGLRVSRADSVSQGAREILAGMGLRPLQIGSQLLSYKLVRNADLVVCLTKEVLQSVASEYKFAAGKTILLQSMTGQTRDIFEPKGASVELNRQCFEMMKPDLDTMLRRFG